MATLDTVESANQEAPPTSNWVQEIAQKFWESQDLQSNRRIPLSKVKRALLETEKGDRMPNSLVVRLLMKADLNNDGYIDYEEYMTFAQAASRYPRRRDTFSRMTMTFVPRNERTVAKRYYLQMYSCCPPPLFMILVSLMEIGAFIYYKVDMVNTSSPLQSVPLYSPLIFSPFRRYEAWRYVTYALLHSGYVHLFGNLLVQLVLGIALEIFHGWWRVGIIYFTGILFGSLAQSIMHPEIFVLGASGGVFAVEYAHIGNLLLNWSQMEFRWVQLIIILVLSTMDLSLAIHDRYFSSTPSNTGHMGHLGGAIAGVTVGIYVLRNFKIEKWERYCWWVALSVFVVLLVAGITLSAALPVPEYFPKDDLSPVGQARIDYLNGRYEWLTKPK
ncbi:rhomboid-related protein 2-like isoform X2 [Macrobrachium nipponense]|uniref:rhomboid-related protein 2-like isoform X2 n=1 Tax=Macrobrachium nipponense TaxID=159736 RepID=UPI0030C7D409